MVDDTDDMTSSANAREDTVKLRKYRSSSRKDALQQLLVDGKINMSEVASWSQVFEIDCDDLSAFDAHVTDARNIDVNTSLSNRPNAVLQPRRT
ncbi:hypothetical protein MCOR25_006980 [Pyricularia grisea]|uniref:Uncharacterized protein n=1 Tax=Pyricularia grisea TaxID=148305 RepID=A0A6P8BCQ8_PYRGI|nr:uncharacterized protein PgNI_03404 [Pyricularia grisea]KAI6359714.1 hypothetical protein MCOR25_006980 [Pyricularia grisea]TLD13656.1 hypothetical protein PgNI_03404 [Pyricularia grisea]